MGTPSKGNKGGYNAIATFDPDGRRGGVFGGNGREYNGECSLHSKMRQHNLQRFLHEIWFV